MIGRLIQLMIASFIFFPTQEYQSLPEEFGLDYETVSLTSQDGTPLSGWYLPGKESKGTLYFLHGNAGNIGDRLFKVEPWVRKGFSVFLLDYRGYGKSEGSIKSDADLYADANAGFRWLKEKKQLPDNRIVLYGESIGSAPAIRLAKNRAWALVLEAPFTSLADVAKQHYPFLPASWISGFQFENKEAIAHVKTPVFVAHGRQDEICPFSMGETLFSHAPDPKEFFAVEGGTHNDLPFAAGKDFYERPYQFILKHQPEEP